LIEIYLCHACSCQEIEGRNATPGGAASDCVADNMAVAGDIGNCADFMEWNAKAQLTTWSGVG
jgi:hypothetical protein